VSYSFSMQNYDHKEIEKRWQKKWQEDNLYKTLDEVKGKQNFYTLVEFPYPSGNLHIGHWYAFAVPDIYARAKRMQGYNVMFPIGFDAFGLPAENAAIKNKVDPHKWTYENIAYMERQLQSMGNSFDWSRKVITSDPEYYRWTQWLFLKLYEKGLVYKNKASVNWCPKDNTVLANEQVVAGKCERCGTEVVQKDLEQWFFKITDYAERLLSDLDGLKWPEPIKEAQRNWIGKSEGAEIEFEIKGLGGVKVFTTRADTLFGVTYLVVAPEHPVIEKLKDLKIENWKEIEKYIKETKSKTEIERMDAKKEKTGVKLDGVTAINPANGEEIPVFVADYVLNNYGTGAVMAVPAHDDRDFEFAKKYNLPIKQVIEPLFITTTGPDAVQKDKPFVERNAIMAIVKHWKEDKYIGLKWKKVDWQTLITGGPEGNQTQEEAAVCEIIEETGYLHPKLVRKLSKVHSQFYHVPKQINRSAHFDVFYFELENSEHKELSDEENSIHEVKWLSQKEMAKFIGPLAQKFAWNELISGIQSYVDEGILTNSEEFDGTKSEEAREKITEKFGEKVVKYKLRDWLLSRQRYWGCPIPIVYDPEGKPHQVPEEKLPWLLPEDVDFNPKGDSPLTTSKELKERVEKIFGKGWKPEYDTMDTFVDSSWYFNRYADPKNEKIFADKEKLKSWMPVKRYSGGAEHTNMHLLYSRFFHKALFDLGLVNEPEPFVERMNRGLILGPDGQKMSKSKGNVVDPDEQVEKVGSDTVKMYLAFIGPYNEVGQYPWDLGGIAGIRRFLERIWKIAQKSEIKGNITPKPPLNLRGGKGELGPRIESLLHKTIKKVTEDIENYKFNTAISSMMIFLNELEKEMGVSKGTFDTFLKLLAPFAPHMTEEIWHELGNEKSIHIEEWPKFDESKIKEKNAVIVVQINGKIRAQFEAEVGISEKEAQNKALSMPEVQKWIAGKEVKKVIFVQGKIINFVV
jgi:leucyl-tRNA synthetase